MFPIDIQTLRQVMLTSKSGFEYQIHWEHHHIHSISALETMQGLFSGCEK